MQGGDAFLFDHRQRSLEMFSLKFAAGVFEQLAAEEAFGLVVFNVVIAPMTPQPSVWPSSLQPLAE